MVTANHAHDTADSHYFKKVVAAVQNGPKSIKYAIALILFVLGAGHFIHALDANSLEHSYRNLRLKEFYQDYLLARALVAGDRLYLPLPDLVHRYLAVQPYHVFPHPSPHPPPVALVLLPLGLLGYQSAAAAWFWAEIGFLLLTAYLLLRWLNGRAGAMGTVFFAALMLCYTPFYEELVLGQLNLLVMFLLVLAWQLLRSGRDAGGGVVLGAAISLKPFIWPFWLFLAVGRNWRALAGTLAVAVGLNLTVAWWAGFGDVTHYYLYLTRDIAAFYGAHQNNFSLYSLGWRIFSGTGGPGLTGAMAPPLVPAPHLAPYISLAVCLPVFLGGFFLAVRARDFDASFAVLVCLSLLVHPTAWSVYLILAFIPGLFVVKRLVQLGWPKRETDVFFMAGILLLIPRGLLLSFGRLFSYGPESRMVPFFPALLVLVPALALLVLLWLIARLEKLPAGSAP